MEFVFFFFRQRPWLRVGKDAHVQTTCLSLDRTKRRRKKRRIGCRLMEGLKLNFPFVASSRATHHHEAADLAGPAKSREDI